MAHSKESIQDLLQRNDKAVIRALYCLYGRQTAQEQAGDHTREVNGVGFNKIDAPLLSDFVRQHKQRGYLSPKQIAISRNKCKRYWRQLVEVANEKITAAQGLVAVDAPAVPATAYNPAVSTDQAYRRYDPRCLCENFDGERKCDWCEEREFDALIQEREREEERARAASKFGTW